MGTFAFSEFGVCNLDNSVCRRQHFGNCQKTELDFLVGKAAIDRRIRRLQNDVSGKGGKKPSPLITVLNLDKTQKLRPEATGEGETTGKTEEPEGGTKETNKGAQTATVAKSAANQEPQEGQGLQSNATSEDTETHLLTIYNSLTSDRYRESTESHQWFSQSNITSNATSDATSAP